MHTTSELCIDPDCADQTRGTHGHRCPTCGSGTFLVPVDETPSQFVVVVVSAAQAKLLRLGTDVAALTDGARWSPSPRSPAGPPVEHAPVNLPAARPDPTTKSEPDYRCPACNTLSGLIVGPTQAFCTNETGCSVFTFDPSLPDGGLSRAVVINLETGRREEEAT